MSYAAYHLAYVRVYLLTAALQTDVDQIRKQEQAFRDMTQVDVTICRAHLAAFFWQLDHFFEALRASITRGQKEQPTEKYFWDYERRLDEAETTAIRKEINDYRNKGHEIPAIIGCAWDKKGCDASVRKELPSLRKPRLLRNSEIDALNECFVPHPATDSRSSAH